jgi:hypothetical protein
VLVLAGLVWASALAPADALADGGTSIGSAPTVTFGQQEFGSTATGGYLTFGCGPGYRSFWNIPVIAGDEVVIDWESATSATEMVVAPVGTTDFNMDHSDNLVEQSLSGNGKNAFEFSATRTGTMPMWFRSCEDSGAMPGAYTFTATDQHTIAISLSNRRHIRTKTVLRAQASLLDGAPVPDGLTFYLTARWASSKIQVKTKSSRGGLRFRVKLPRLTAGRSVSFTVSRPADQRFRRARSASLPVQVVQPHSSQCRRGFRRIRLHGKPRCVKFE